MNLVGFGECLPYKDNRVTIEQERHRRLRHPGAAHQHGVGREREDDDPRHGGQRRPRCSRPPGAKNVRTFALEDRVPGYGIHEMGMARMGSDPKTSVLNQFQQAHDVKNLFVMDAAGFPSGGCQNPTLTIMAMAVRSTRPPDGRAEEGNIWAQLANCRANYQRSGA